MPALDFGGNHHSAGSAAKQTAKGFWRVAGVMVRAGSFFEHFLDAIIKLFGNKRLVLAFVKFAAIAKQSAIKRIGENKRNAG